MLKVFRPRNATPIESSEATLSVLKELEADIPEGVTYAVWNDSSRNLQRPHRPAPAERVDGFDLVFIILGLLLEPGLGLLGDDVVFHLVPRCVPAHSRL